MILEIHEITPKILDFIKNPKNLRGIELLTFDDGLYSQFYYRAAFENLNIDRVYFISSAIICPENVEQQIIDIPCHTAHQMVFNIRDCSAYMKMSQIQILQNEGAEVGSHSHEHKHFTDFSDFKINLELSLKIFKQNNIIIKKYLAPYNHRFLLGDAYVDYIGLKNILGRVRIEELL